MHPAKTILIGLVFEPSGGGDGGKVEWQPELAKAAIAEGKISMCSVTLHGERRPRVVWKGLDTGEGLEPVRGRWLFNAGG